MINEYKKIINETLNIYFDEILENKTHAFAKKTAESMKYTTMKANLEELLNKVTTTRTISFDIPNFMSKLMFVMPEDVKVTSITVRDGRVAMSAESGQYSQLGYFVSRLKLDKVLANVDMSV